MLTEAKDRYVLLPFGWTVGSPAFVLDHADDMRIEFRPGGG